MATESSASLLLKKQLRDLTKKPIEGFSAGLVDDSNIFEWDIMILGPEGTLYEGGFFKARLTFPTQYPNMPPEMRFVSDMWHPNVYSDGKVCISILHPPGKIKNRVTLCEDKYGYEQASERWLPVHTVETIILSVISMLSDPNDESPANIDAAREWRQEPLVFKKKVQRTVRKTLED